MRSLRARDVMAALRAHLQEQARRLAQHGIETVGNSMVPYLKGALQTLTAIRPELLAPLQAELADSVCSGTPSEHDMMLFATAGIVNPALASSRGVDCVVARHETEDVVLWSVLDAWRAARLPRSPALEAIAANAKDERTTRRFRGKDEEIALRSIVPENTQTGRTNEGEETTHEKRQREPGEQQKTR